MARESSNRAPHESPSPQTSRLPTSDLGLPTSDFGVTFVAFAWWCLLRWNCPRDSAKRESLYQSASKTIKRQTDSAAKTPKIRAELFFQRARVARASPARSAPIQFLRRRRRMRFRETIEQHFRRMLVSKRIRSRERGSSHEMGAGAIDVRTIASVSTEISEGARAHLTTSRRRRCDRARSGFETPSSSKK